MSDAWGESLPILYGRSVATGEIVHVDDAPNGKACGRLCSDAGDNMVRELSGECAKQHHNEAL